MGSCCCSAQLCGACLPLCLLRFILKFSSVLMAQSFCCSLWPTQAFRVLAPGMLLPFWAFDSSACCSANHDGMLASQFLRFLAHDLPG